MPTSNSINANSTGLVRYDGAGTFDAVTTTIHDILIGAATNGITNVAPSATSGVPVISQGAAADPIFGTAVVAGGGTGQTTLTNHALLVGATTAAITQLSVGATGTVLIGTTGSDPSFSATPTVTSITISNAPVSGTDGTNKTYVDTAIAAVNPATSVYAATTTNIPGVYLNGAAGIGATFVTTAVGAFTLDGTTPPLLSRILYKDQSSTLQNGVYVLTTNGTGITGSTFTRAVDYDQPSDINSTGPIGVLNGTVNKLTSWLINVIVTSVGVDPITYTLFQNAPITTTQYAVLVGGAANAVNSVGPSATAGQALLSGGNAANPAYSTPTYPSASGSSGKVLISDGTNNVYSTPTYPSASGSTGVILRSDGTNNVYTTATYPASTTVSQLLYSSSTNVIGGITTANDGLLVTSNTGVPSILAGPGTTGNVLQSNSVLAPSFSTATYPSVATGTGTILRADGTNWVATTATYPATTTINQVLYSSSANVIGGITAANNGVYISGTTGIPSVLANGTTGQLLTATTGSPPSWASPATATITITGDSGGALSSSSFTLTGGTTGHTFAGSGSTLTLGGTLVVANGGTGRATLTNHGVLVGATTTAITQLAAGSAGQVLQSGGASADPAYSTPTYPSASGSAGQILRSDGTNNLYTTSTYPNTNAVSTLLYASSANVMGALATANDGLLVTSNSGVPSILAGPGTSGNVLQSNSAAAPSFSTPTYPSASGSAGQILRSDGTNNVYSTSTYPNTNAVSTLLYASSANVMAALTTANTGVLVTNGSGVPAWQTAGTSWTPNLQINSSSTGITYTTQVGYWSQIGDLVFISCSIVLSSKGASTGTVAISNLPVTPGAHAQNFAIAIGYATGVTNAGSTTLGFIPTNSTVTGIFYLTSLTAGTVVALANTMISNSFTVDFNGYYITD